MTKKDKALIRRLLVLLSSQTSEIILWGIPDVVVEREIGFIRKELGLDDN